LRLDPARVEIAAPEQSVEEHERDFRLFSTKGGKLLIAAQEHGPP